MGGPGQQPARRQQDRRHRADRHDRPRCVAACWREHNGLPYNLPVPQGRQGQAGGIQGRKGRALVYGVYGEV